MQTFIVVKHWTWRNWRSNPYAQTKQSITTIRLHLGIEKIRKPMFCTSNYTLYTTYIVYNISAWTLLHQKAAVSFLHIVYMNHTHFHLLIQFIDSIRLSNCTQINIIFLVAISFCSELFHKFQLKGCQNSIEMFYIIIYYLEQQQPEYVVHKIWISECWCTGTRRLLWFDLIRKIPNEL